MLKHTHLLSDMSRSSKRDKRQAFVCGHCISHISSSTNQATNRAGKIILFQNICYNLGCGNATQWSWWSSFPNHCVAANLKKGKNLNSVCSFHLNIISITIAMALFHPKTATGKLKAVMIPMVPRGFHISKRAWFGLSEGITFPSNILDKPTA